MKSTVKAALSGLLLALPLPLQAAPRQIEATATSETLGSKGDVDDPAIWVNPSDPAASRILGTDKTRGLFVYDLSGQEVAFLPDGRLNNVDLRPFVLDGKDVAVVGATRRDDDTLALYLLDGDGLRPATPHLVPAIPEGVEGVDDIYGFAMARLGDEVHAIVNFKSGHVVQWRLRDMGGTIGTELVRVVKVGSQPEGMVADDAAGHLYIGEEDVGIWRFPLDPAVTAVPQAVATIPSDCLPRDDVEGLAIHDSPAGRFLIASAQGVHRAAIFRLEGEALPACVGMVEIVAGAVDGVTETDGLDVTALPVGPDYPQGLLVMMDDQNAGYSTNFKLIDWRQIAPDLSK
jgi:3-phytase